MMDITAIEKELQALLLLTNGWGELGHTTNIEKDVALSRVRALYDAILAVETVAAPMVADVVADVDVEQNFVGDESFEEQPYGENSYGEELSCQADIEEAQPEEQPEQQDGGDEGDEQEYGGEDSGEDEGDEQEDEDEGDEDEQEEKPKASLTDFRKEIEIEREQRFIHDLFCNDANFYHHELGKIEQLDSLDDVLIYIGQKYTWSPDNISAQQFVELQASRFGL